MPTRSERRRLMRRKAKRKALHNHQEQTNLGFWNELFCGNNRHINLILRQGSIRHQPKAVRQIVLGKRLMQTAEEKKEEEEYFVNLSKRIFHSVTESDMDGLDDCITELEDKVGKGKHR